MRACIEIPDDHTLIVVECHPTLGRNNTRYADRRSKRLSDEYHKYKDFVGVGWFKAGSPRFETGIIGMKVVSYWDRWRHLDDKKIKTPVADVDAIDKCTLDALQDENGCGCIDDDVRIRPLILDKDYDRNFPRVEIFIWSEHEQG